MAATVKRYQKVVRDTASTLTVANLVYPLGYKIIESDTDKWKEGDGLTTYNNLPYLPENLTTKFDPIDAYEYQQSTNDTRVRFRDRSSSLRWMHLLGIDILNETMLAKFAESFGNTLQSGYTRGTWIYIETPTVISELIAFVKTAGVYTATGTNQMGVYSYNMATRVATRVALTANDGNMWKTAGARRIPLASPYTAQPGLYLIVAGHEASATTTAPVLLAKQVDGNTSAEFEGHRLAGTFGTTAGGMMPTTVDMSTLIAYSVMYWFGIA